MTNVGHFKKSLAIILSTLMVFTMLPVSLLKVKAAENDRTTLYLDDGNISISGDTATYNTATIEKTATNANGFIITQHNSAIPIFWKIFVTSGKANITLQNINISEKKFDFGCAFTIAPGASVNLTLSGKNKVESSSLSAGISVPLGAELSINGTGNDSLMAIGGGNAAGIGGGNAKVLQRADDSDCGTVNISGGIITAIGYAGGAGIGGGTSNGDGGKVNISGGTITAIGDGGGAGIGGVCKGKGGTTIITGGSVYATGSNGINDIQGGVKGSSGCIKHCVTVDTSNIIGANKNLSALVQNGTLSQIKTDDNGKLYFWMDEKTTDFAILQYGSVFFKLSILLGTLDTTTTLSETSQMTALDLSQESISIGASSITAKDTDLHDASLNPNGYIIKQSAQGSTSNTISVNDGVQTIMLWNINIESTRSASFYIASGASVNLSLSGANTLKSSQYIGLMVPSGASLTVLGGDSLTVNSGSTYMGIGGGSYGSGNLIIDGGTINTYGGDYGAGIDNNLTINGGNITAVGGSAGNAGIGGSRGKSGGTTIINGGCINAIGNGGGAGIGGGYSYGNGGNITINGGCITATGNRGGAGIGGGAQAGGGGTVTITGGKITANGNGGGAGIGGGQGVIRTSGRGDDGGCGAAITISGGTITATGHNGGADIGGGAPGGRGGKQGNAGTAMITGGSVNASIQNPPTSNGTTLTYPTTITLPSGKNINNLSIIQNNNISYGISDMETDSNRTLYLYLPAYTKDTNINVTTDTAIYNGYHGTIEASKINILKMNQNALVINGISDNENYTYGNVPTATAIGGNSKGSLSYTYSGIGNTSYNSSNKPSNAGTYSVTIEKKGDNIYYSTDVTALFTIIPKTLTDSDINISIPVQKYTGSTLTPSIILTYNETTLIEGTDYTTSFINNKEAAQSTDPHPPTEIFTFIGNYTGISSKTFTIEVAPTISVSHFPTNLDHWSARINFTITVSAGSSGIKSLTVKKNTDNTATDIQDTFNNENYSYAATENGLYTFTVTSNSGFTASNTVQVNKIDTFAPSIKNVIGNPKTPAQSALLSATVMPCASGIDSVTISHYYNGNWNVLTEASITDSINEDNSHTYSYSVTKNGTYKFKVTSMANVSTDSNINITNIDTAKPKITIIAKKTDAKNYTSDNWTNQNVMMNVSNTTSNLGTTKFEYLINNSKVWIPFDGNIMNTDEGIKTYQFRATSESGVISEIQSITVKIDKSAPEIKVSQTSLSTTSPSATIPFTVEDKGAGIDTVNYRISKNPTKSITIAKSHTDSAEKRSFAIDVLPEGTYDVVINAVDNLGNNADSVTLHVHKDTSPKVTDVTITPSAVSINHGTSQTFLAKVFGINSPSTNVIWTVSGGKSNATTIDTNGKLAVAIDESATTLTVTATSSYDKTKIGQAIININAVDQIGFSFSSFPIFKTYNDMPFTINTVGGQGSGKVTYIVSSGDDIISIKGNRVTIKKAGTAVISAIKEADGSFREATTALTLYINKSTTNITELPKTSKINVVGKLSTCKLTGGNANVPGTFAWANPNAVVTASGNYDAIFTPTDTKNYYSRPCTIKVIVNPVINNNQSEIAFDLTNAILPKGITSVSVNSFLQSKLIVNSTSSIIKHQIGNGEKLDDLIIYNLNLVDQNRNPITSFTGEITVRIPIPKGLSGNLHVYWYNDKNDTATDMNAKQENGYLVFKTTHFSYYAIAEVSILNSSSSCSVPSPTTSDHSFPYLPIALLGVTGCVIAVVFKNKRLCKKK